MFAVNTGRELFKGIKMSSTETRQRIEPNIDLKEPSLFKVIYLNDDFTSMEFVINSLVEYFNYNEESALNVTHNIHNEGAAIVAILPHEIAEQKGIEVSLDARAQGYPLQIKLEPESA
jgi:ATP-dependent Clp protease adaptor protein ClpS